ncbi:MAG: radical SAM protein, partial [Oscillospiraceae bacterium]|nr:radical SAM protein [Oscillospiraceae bacterium]
MAVIISDVQKRSLAFKAGIPAKATLLTINDNEINDVLDYQFYITERRVDLVCLVDGNEKKFTIKKDEYEDIGLIFDSYLMDKQHHCKNKCIFCFIDQMPKGMRESLYFKDDDDRMSFLFGNYVTLTNLTQKDIDRII